ncbi:TetR family transcriptional regulator [Lentilactobacillus curieae]|uniref:TetR family transcriptional regulator n=1 Tax=Lentilactobacillus curieae TaxID=1138822 RepID=A0A1S6QHI2_9LACO|nr:TetR/AcrR family transcriptional regulator [Lentilactobacillus curieae]AQW21062.1 TetR family transcriptional regulator [Lentilactobacillus curieae]
MTSTSIKSFYNEDINTDENLPNKQKQVIKAALELFSTKGFSQTTTTDIAEKAGVSQGTVYKRFRTKDELLQAVLSPIFQKSLPKAIDEFKNQVESADQSDLRKLLKYSFQNRFEFIIANQQYIKIMFTEALSNDQLKSELIQAFSALSLGALPKIIEKFKAEKKIVDWPTKRIVQYLIATGASYAVQPILLDLPLDPDQASTDAAEFLYQALSVK